MADPKLPEGRKPEIQPCSNCGNDIVDRKQSNKNWTVYSAKCPGCGQPTNKQVLAIILKSTVGKNK